MPRLEIELVPETCWWSNVRSQVTKSQWEKCKKFVRTRSGDKCEICGGRGQKWPVECHEIWEYDDDKQIQTLVGLIALCPKCHQAKHLGRSELVLPTSEYHSLVYHIVKINGWTFHDFSEYRDRVFAIWSIRSDWQWGLDVSYLREVGLELPQYVWGPSERVVV